MTATDRSLRSKSHETKNNKKTSPKKIRFEQVPKTKASYAPLFMQEQDKRTTIVDLMLRKYGMIGKEKAAPPKQKNLQKKGMGSMDTSEQSWAYASITEGTDCSGQEYMTAGVKLNNCFVDGHVYKTGMLLTCDDGQIAYHLYDNDECSGSPTESTTVAVEGCQQPSQAIINSWWSFDDDYYQKVILIISYILTYPHSNTQPSIDIH